jgi:RNA-binding protein
MSEIKPPLPNPVSLTGAQKRHLRGLGHHLKPVVWIGTGGVTEGVISATVELLEREELIKISSGQEAPDGRKDGPRLLAEAAGAHVAQIIGRTALLYRRWHKDPLIKLPGSVEESPRPEDGGTA